MNKKDLSAYMRKIGRIGGTKSRRVLTTEQATKMAALSHKSKQERIAIARKAGKAPKKPRKK